MKFFTADETAAFWAVTVTGAVLAVLSLGTAGASTVLLCSVLTGVGAAKEAATCFNWAPKTLFSASSTGAGVLGLALVALVALVAAMMGR